MNTKTKIKSGELTEARREFLRKSGSIAAMSMFGVAFFTSCSSDDMEPEMGDPKNPPSSGNGITVSNNEIRVDLGLASSLSTAGSWALVIDAKVLIVNLGSNSFSALTSVCTHTGCDRNWSFSNNLFICSCHGSRFNTDGSVANGPANQPLRTYPISVSNNILTVDLS